MSVIPEPPARHGVATLTELSRTLARACGVDLAGPDLAVRAPDGRPALDASRLASARTIVLVLLDGAGSAAVARHVPGGTLAGGERARIDSVFPSSTAPAISTVASALSPAEHAHAGWFLWHETLPRVVRSLPMDWRDAPGEAVTDWRWHWTGWCAAAPIESVAIQPVEIHDSVYSRHAFAGARRLGYSDLDEFVDLTVEAARTAGPGRRFVYAYAPHFDSTSHAHGWRGDAAADCLSRLDAAVARILDGLDGNDAVVLATADHGFTDIDPDNQFPLEAFPGLARGLALPLAGEPRMAFARVHEGTTGHVVDAGARALEGIADVYPSRALLDAGWFGACGDARAVRAFGDVSIVMRPGMALTDRLEGERPHRMLGMHGGTTREEMSVPLAVWEMR